MKQPKPRACKCGCRQKFIPRNSMQIAAGPDCALRLVQKKREKDERAAANEQRRATKEAKDRLKTRSDYMREAQVAFNAFIRERDKDQPCICCGLPLQSMINGNVTIHASGGGYDCGHYRSVGSAPHLRFDERNAHAQRKQCNRWGAGRAVDYRIGLIRRIGLAEVEALEADQSVKKWSADDLMRIRDEYRKKLKDLRNVAVKFNATSTSTEAA